VLPDGREHFGFADGFGQPKPVVAGRGRTERDRQEAGRTTALGEFVHGYRDEDGGLPPAPAPPFDRNGTFMVFRKLAQDVMGFRALLRELAWWHFNSDQELTAAKLVGRWRDGTPLIQRPTPATAPPRRANRLNDFGYGGDPDGYSCPIGAHIRRANPRDGLHGGYKRTRRHRIMRRGMPYGPWLPAIGPDADPSDAEDKRGLLFVCLNTSIANQFEVVNGWLNDGAAFGLGSDVDVLAGTGPVGMMSVQGAPPVLMAGRSLVWTRGGEYLFLPSLHALDALAAGWDG
jgi:Dyp-type peroxidase family